MSTYESAVLRSINDIHREKKHWKRSLIRLRKLKRKCSIFEANKCVFTSLYVKQLRESCIIITELKRFSNIYATDNAAIIPISLQTDNLMILLKAQRLATAFIKSFNFFILISQNKL